MPSRHFACTSGMQRPRVCISHSVWVLMALQTCLGLSTFLCHGWIFSEPLNETDTKYGYCPYRHLLSLTLPLTGAPAPITAPSSVWVFAQSCSGVSLNCLTFQWSPRPQSPRFKFSFNHGSELGSIFSFSVSVHCGWRGLLVVWICPLARRFPQAFHASNRSCDPATGLWDCLKIYQFFICTIPEWKKKGHQGSGRDYVCIHSPQNCLKKGWRADQMA